MMTALTSVLGLLVPTLLIGGCEMATSKFSSKFSLCN